MLSTRHDGVVLDQKWHIPHFRIWPLKHPHRNSLPITDIQL